MVPDADLQLAVVIKALRDVVSPAVDPANRLALEQLHLSIATLGMVRSGLPLQHQRARRELMNAVTLAGLIVQAGARSPHALSTARAALDDASMGPGAIDSVRLKLLGEIESAVAAAAGAPEEKTVALAVLKGSRAQFDLARSWCSAAGFEVHSGEVPPLDHVLAE